MSYLLGSSACIQIKWHVLDNLLKNMKYIYNILIYLSKHNIEHFWIDSMIKYAELASIFLRNKRSQSYMMPWSHEILFVDKQVVWFISIMVFLFNWHVWWVELIDILNVLFHWREWWLIWLTWMIIWFDRHNKWLTMIGINHILIWLIWMMIWFDWRIVMNDMFDIFIWLMWVTIWFDWHNKWLNMIIWLVWKMICFD